MPRRKRRYLPNIPAHIVQRGTNRHVCFKTPEDYEVYLNALGEALSRYHVKLHAYCLMTNHVHLLMNPMDSDGISRVMQHIGRVYVCYFNKRYRRTGTLWEGRHKASLIQENEYFLACCRYIELNPVKVRMVNRPEDYPWSSYPGNALRESNALITTHPLINAMGSKDIPYSIAYQQFVTNYSGHDDQDIQTKTEKSWPLGNGEFLEMVAHQLGCSLGHLNPGRPAELINTEPERNDQR